MSYYKSVFRRILQLGYGHNVVPFRFNRGFYGVPTFAIKCKYDTGCKGDNNFDRLATTYYPTHLLYYNTEYVDKYKFTLKDINAQSSSAPLVFEVKAKEGGEIKTDTTVIAAVSNAYSINTYYTDFADRLKDRFGNGIQRSSDTADPLYPTTFTVYGVKNIEGGTQDIEFVKAGAIFNVNISAKNVGGQSLNLYEYSDLLPEHIYSFRDELTVYKMEELHLVVTADTDVSSLE